MRFRSSKTIKKEFLNSRKKQSEKDFFAGCGLPSKFSCNALKVRTAIANLSRVDAEDVHAEDTFDGDLVHFDFWGSLDTIGLILELEKCLRIQINDENARQINNPELRPGTTVAEFVQSVLNVVQEQSEHPEEGKEEVLDTVNP